MMGMKHKTFVGSLKDAFRGLFFAIRHERNMGYHLLVAAFVLAASFYYHLDRTEFLFVFTAIFLVILTEMFNTAVETLVDLYTSEYHPLAGIAKRVAAGAVLCAAFFALVVAYLVFADKLW
jgi:diacylglycerol kinase (ATP)